MDAPAPAVGPTGTARHAAVVQALAALLEEARRGLAAAESLDRVHGRVLPRWRELVESAAAHARALRADPPAFEAARRWTHGLLAPLLTQGPIWRRSLDKPRGYPGDYAVMNYVYDQHDAGDTPFARLCHRLGLDVGACVRTRAHWMSAELARLMQAHAPGVPFRATSLGCGSARELGPALRAAPPAEALLTLVDQDDEALASAAAHLGRPAAAQCRFVAQDFGALLREPARLQAWAGQDLVYCIGLLDYVADAALPALATALWSLVRPGGTLVLGNMRHPSSTFWPLEFVCDWRLRYRSAAAMLALAALPAVEHHALALEQTGRNFLLSLRKAR